MVIAKSLIQKPKLVVFDEPTRGVDVGAILEIHNFINQLADQVIAAIVMSSYLLEIPSMPNRILVVRGGKVLEEMTAREAIEKKTMYAAVH